MLVFGVLSVAVIVASPRSRLQLGRAMNGGPDTRIGAAATDIRHRVVDVGVGRLWRLLEERDSRHDLPGLAISALRNIELDPRQLDRVRSVCGQPFDRSNVLA